MSRADFVQQIYQSALAAGLTDAAARVTASQAALESNYGTRAPGNNLFGIKAGKSWTGPTQTLTTHERKVDGTTVKIKQKFRVYDTPEAAIADRVKFMGDKFPGFNEAKDTGEALTTLQHGKFGKYYTAKQSEYEGGINNINTKYLGGTPVPPENVGQDGMLTAVASQLDTTPSKMYKVKNGDTLSKIAKEAGTDLNSILSLNEDIKNPNKIKVGQHIDVPIKGSTPAPKGASGTIDGSAGAGNKVASGSVGFNGNQKSWFNPDGLDLTGIVKPQSMSSAVQGKPNPKQTNIFSGAVADASGQSTQKKGTESLSVNGGIGGSAGGKQADDGLLSLTSLKLSPSKATSTLESIHDKTQITPQSIGVIPVLASLFASGDAKVPAGMSGGVTLDGTKSGQAAFAGSVADATASTKAGAKKGTSKIIVPNKGFSGVQSSASGASGPVRADGVGNGPSNPASLLGATPALQDGGILGGLGNMLKSGIDSIKINGTQALQKAMPLIDQAKDATINFVMSTPEGRGAIINPIINKIGSDTTRYLPTQENLAAVSNNNTKAATSDPSGSYKGADGSAVKQVIVDHYNNDTQQWEKVARFK